MPRFERELYRDLAHSSCFEACFWSTPYTSFRKLLAQENKLLFEELASEDSFSLKQKISVLNYLMRATSRCSPYKNFSGDASLVLGETNQYKSSDIKLVEEEPSDDITNLQRVRDPILTEYEGGYLFANSNQCGFSKQEAFIQENCTNLVSNINPFDNILKKSQLNFHLSEPEISEEELSDVAMTLYQLRFLNGNHVNRSIYWIENIRKELFELVDARPIELRKALLGLRSMQTSKQELVSEVDKRILPIREKFMEIACSTSKEVELSKEDIKFFIIHKKATPANLSQDYSVVMTPTADKFFVEFFRSSFKGFRVIAETLAKVDTWKPPLVSNSKILYFDLISSGKKDVLQSRPKVTEYALSVDGTTVPDDCTEIHLDDLYVYASHSEIVLFSKRLNKRVLPILTTNYLAENDSNIIWKFLASLSKTYFNDGLFIDLAWLKTPHIPRISYRGLVLFPETWNIKKDEIATALKHLPSQFRVIEGDRKLLVYRDSKYSLAQILKVKNDIITITEELTDDSLDRHHEISFHFSTDSKVDDLNFYPFKDEVNIKFNKEIKINELRFSGPYNLMESFAISQLRREVIDLPFYFISYHFPKPEIRLRVFGDRKKFLEIKEKITEHEFFKNIIMVSETDYRSEPDKYINEEGEKLYIDSNIKMNGSYQEIKRLVMNLTTHRYPSFGSPGEIVYLAFLANFLLNENLIDFKVGHYAQKSTHAIEKQVYEFIRNNNDNPLMKILEGKAKRMASELEKNISSFEKLVKNNDLKKPDRYLALRLIHIEVFRLCLFPPTDYNSLVLNIAKRIQRSIRSKRK